jgi:hypothetical protein
LVQPSTYKPADRRLLDLRFGSALNRGHGSQPGLPDLDLHLAQSLVQGSELGGSGSP